MPSINIQQSTSTDVTTQSYCDKVARRRRTQLTRCIPEISQVGSAPSQFAHAVANHANVCVQLARVQPLLQTLFCQRAPCAARLRLWLSLWRSYAFLFWGWHWRQPLGCGRWCSWRRNGGGRSASNNKTSGLLWEGKELLLNMAVSAFSNPDVQN